MYIQVLLLIIFFQYNPVYDVVVSTDKAGMVEYWSGLKNDCNFPKNVKFEFKTDTDLFEFIMVGTQNSQKLVLWYFM